MKTLTFAEQLLRARNCLKYVLTYSILTVTHEGIILPIYRWVAEARRC